MACAFFRGGKLQEGFERLSPSPQIDFCLHNYLAGWLKGHFILLPVGAAMFALTAGGAGR
jgi:hypothetical protein